MMYTVGNEERDTMNLRDHDRACEHSGAVQGVRLRNNQRLHWECRRAECPGGAVVTIDYQAADAILQSATDVNWTDRIVKGVNAALGLTDEAVV